MELIKMIWDDYRKYCLIGICVVVGIIVILFTHKAPNNNLDMPVSTENTQSSSQKKLTTQSSDTHSVAYVDVKGAVKQPGVYKLRQGLRAQDAIDCAGGVIVGADVNHVNMAQAVTDQQVLYVPMQGENNTPIGANNGQSSASGDSQADVVNLNTATKEQLTKITGVGDKKADLILQYREQHGQFKVIDDLKEVSGFGDKSVDKIRDQLSI